MAKNRDSRNRITPRLGKHHSLRVPLHTEYRHLRMLDSFYVFVVPICRHAKPLTEHLYRLMMSTVYGKSIAIKLFYDTVGLSRNDMRRILLPDFFVKLVIGYMLIKRATEKDVDNLKSATYSKNWFSCINVCAKKRELSFISVAVLSTDTT